MNRLKMLFVIGLITIFTACSTDNSENNNGDDFTENMQIYIYEGDNIRNETNFDNHKEWNGNGIVKIILRNENGTDTLITMGSVTNGILKFELPETIPEKWLKIWKEFYLTDSASSEDAKGIIEDTFWLFADENDNRPFVFAYVSENFTNIVSYAFSLKPINGSGDAIIDTDELDEFATYNLDINAGWNRIYALDNRINFIGEIIFSTSPEILTSNPNNFRWVIFGSNEYP